MTQVKENNLLATLMQMINENRVEAVAETFRILLNEAMKICLECCYVRHIMAALSVPFATQCCRLCAQDQDAKEGSQRYS